MVHTYSKKLYLKYKFKWPYFIFSGNPTKRQISPDVLLKCVLYQYVSNALACPLETNHSLTTDLIT